MIRLILKSTKLLLIALVVVAGLIACVAIWGGKPLTGKPGSGVGDTGMLEIPGSTDKVPVAKSHAAYDRWVQLAAAKDDVGMAKMVQAGEVHLVDRGTKVKVIDRGFGYREVRILDGPFATESGFVTMEWVK